MTARPWYRLESRTLLAGRAYRTDHVEDYGPDRDAALFDWARETESSAGWYAPDSGRRLVVVEVTR